jgi:hypothetical protein
MRSDQIINGVYGADITQTQQQQAQQAQQVAGSLNLSLPSGSIGQTLAPVMAMEKTDLMFWMLAVQTVLLILIWRQG